MTDKPTQRQAKLGRMVEKIVSAELVELARREAAAKDDLKKFKSSGYFIMYHRYSPRPDQSARESMDSAKLLLLQYGLAMGLKPRRHTTTGVELFFCDGGEKRDSPERPQLMKCLLETEPGDVIVVASPDRISNVDMYYAAITTAVHEAGCRFEFADGTEPDVSDEAELVRIIRSWANRTELKKKRKRAKDRHKNLCKLGLWSPFANKPYGHDKVVIGKDSAGRNVYQLVENKEEQAVILYILMLYMRGPRNGGGRRAIAKRLNEEGIAPPSHGKQWWPTKVKQIIHREFDRYGIPKDRNEIELADQHQALRRLGIIKAGKKQRPWSERKHELYQLAKPEYVHPPNKDESVLFNDALNKETANDEDE